MAIGTPRSWLICYDVTDPKRLMRLHRFLRRHAAHVQYSVFHFEGSAAAMGRLMHSVEHRIDPESDDVRAYLIPERLQLDTLGRGQLPGDTLLISEHSPGLTTLLSQAKAC